MFAVGCTLRCICLLAVFTALLPSISLFFALAALFIASLPRILPFPRIDYSVSGYIAAHNPFPALTTLFTAELPHTPFFPARLATSLPSSHTFLFIEASFYNGAFPLAVLGSTKGLQRHQLQLIMIPHDRSHSYQTSHIKYGIRNEKALEARAHNVP